MSKECIPLDLHNNFNTEIIFTDDSGNYPEGRRFDQVEEFGAYSIGTFRKKKGTGGTGFIINVLSPSSEVVALVMTAAHIFITNFKYLYEPIEFLIGNDIYEALPLKATIDLDDLSLRYRDPITGVRLSVPDDWVICELRKIPNLIYSSKLASLKFYRSLDSVIGRSVSLIGFPNIIDPSNISQICPEAKTSSIDLLSNCIHGGQKLIETQGIIKNYENLIAVTCCSASGMSGSPLFIKNNGKFEVLGLLFGGPATEIQYFVSEILYKPHLCLLYFEQIENYFKDKISNQTDIKNINILKNRLKSVMNFRDIYAEESCLCEYTEGSLKLLYTSALKIEFQLGNPLKYNLCTNICHLLMTIDSISNNYH